MRIKQNCLIAIFGKEVLIFCYIISDIIADDDKQGLLKSVRHYAKPGPLAGLKIKRKVRMLNREQIFKCKNLIKSRIKQLT